MVILLALLCSTLDVLPDVHLRGTHCADFSCVGMLRILGKKCTLEQVASDFSQADGTGSSAEILAVLKKHGVEAVGYQIPLDDVLAIDGPIIIRTVNSQRTMSHFLLVARLGSKSFVVDSANDIPIELTSQGVERLRRFYAGDAIVVFGNAPLVVRYPWLLGTSYALSMAALFMTAYWLWHTIWQGRSKVQVHHAAQ